MNPVTHFELPYHDARRASHFYETVFGWELQPLGEDMGNYILATTAIEDVIPGSPAGAINGGLYPYKKDWPDQYPSVVIGVGDINETMKAIIANGGEVLGNPRVIPGFGDYVAFRDTEGNRLSLMQPEM